MCSPRLSFSFPLDDSLILSLSSFLSPLRRSVDERIVVVADVGASRFSRRRADVTEPQAALIEGHVDLDRRVLFLHLVDDGVVLSRACADYVREESLFAARKREDEEKEGEGSPIFHSFLSSAQFSSARALLFLFSVSHLVVVNNPGSRFDISLVRLFRNLELVRQKLQPTLTETLRSVGGGGISKDWIYAGRPCSPRMLFVFERNPLKGVGVAAASRSFSACLSAPPSIHGFNNNNSNASSSSYAVDEEEYAEDEEGLEDRGAATTSSADSLKRLQHTMEDQIYRILRKARIITNVSNNSLFAVPANEEFVYIVAREDGDGGGGGILEDPASYLLSKLSASFSVGDAASQASKSSASLSSSSSSSLRPGVIASAESRSSASLGQTKRRLSLDDFIQNHIDQALDRGFDDNLGRNPVPAIFELPRVDVWFGVAGAVYDLILGAGDSRTASAMANLKSLLDLDTKFSEARCSKVVPVALATYQEGVLSHYTRSFHQKRFAHARTVYNTHARGPSYGAHLKRLKEQCEAIWRDGRQSCEATTLTGNHCIHALHRLIADDDDSDFQLPAKPHATLNKTLAASDCGTRQASREDPFDLCAANFSYYESLDEGIYDKFEFSLVQGESPGFRDRENGEEKQSDEVRLTPGGEKRVQTLDSSLALAAEKNPTSLSATTTTTTTFLLAEQTTFSLGSEEIPFEDGGEEDEEEGEEESESGRFSKTWTAEEAAPNTLFSSSSSSPSPVTLQGLLTTTTQLGATVKFPSWSLTRIGNAGSYNAGKGLDQPGFIAGSNFLLPWDLLTAVDASAAAGGKTSTPKAKTTKGYLRQKKNLIAVSSKESEAMTTTTTTIRAYVGYEYECPRGHRFISSCPDAAVNPASSPAERLVASDMPLYTLCTCRDRSTKVFIAQLMRVFVVTPDRGSRDAPSVSFFLAPRVQPAPPPCPIFHPGGSTTEPIPLEPNCVWVLRLPYVYADEQRVYGQPKDVTLFPSCRVMRGLLTSKISNGEQV